MAESLGTIYYDVDANLEPLLGKMRQAESALGGLGKEMGKTDQGAAQMQKSFDKTERSAASLGGQLNGLTRVIKGVVAAMAIREMAGMVQQYQTMSERVQMATQSAEEFDLVQRRLQATADGTYRALSEAQEIYIQTSSSLRSMGYEAEHMLDITDSLSYAFVKSATSTDRANVAMGAFSRSLAKGRVDADAWEMILVSIPDIADQLAGSMGIAAQEVRALGAAGKITTRDLTEGLRTALEANKAAADGMATDLIDAGVRVRNALTTVLVALEEQTGGIQMVTDGIIAASEALLEFGQDSEKMAEFLGLATTAATAMATVIAANLLVSVGASTVALYKQAAALHASTIGARAKAAADLAAAKTEAEAAAAHLVKAQAIERASRATTNHAATVTHLSAAQARATAATTALTTATAASGAVAITTTRAFAAMRTALAFLAAPAGLLLVAATAMLTFGSSARRAADDTELLTGSINDLTTAQRELMRIQIVREMDALEKAAAKTARQIDLHTRAMERTNYASEELERSHKEHLVSLQAEWDATTQKIDQYGKRLQEIGNFNIPAPQGTGGTTEPTLTDSTSRELTEFQKLEQSLKNQAALAKLTGLARAELAALQRLGADATEEERARIKELVGEIYRLEESQKAAQKAEQDRLKTSEEARRAAEDNAGVIAGLREQLHQTTLAADDLAARQAELSLNDYATPEQVEQVRTLARELYAAQQEAALLEQRRSAFTGDAAGAIRGQVSPLSGGAFDDQAARYEAEAAAEQERYAAQLERLREAKELEIEVIGGYQALEEQMAQEHADRLMQIEEARVQAMAAQSAAAFGQMASDLEAFAKTFGAENSKMMAIAKASAIAQTIMETYAGAQKAFSALAGIPYVGPALGAAAAAAAVAGGMARVAQIRGTSGRLAGGPVSASSMYRVNENGAPEVFSAANGQQFMIPNQRGEVISNRNATAGEGGVVINIHNAPQGTVAESSQDQDGQQMIDIWVADFMADGRTASAVQGRFGLSPQGR